MMRRKRKRIILTQYLSRPSKASESILGERPRIEATEAALQSTRVPIIQLEDEDGEDGDDITPLPENSSIQRRTSGRVTKRIRRVEDMYEY